MTQLTRPPRVSELLVPATDVVGRVRCSGWFGDWPTPRPGIAIEDSGLTSPGSRSARLAR